MCNTPGGAPLPAGIQFPVFAVGRESFLISPILQQHIAALIYRIGIVEWEERCLAIRRAQSFRHVALEPVRPGEMLVGRGVTVIQAQKLFGHRREV